MVPITGRASSFRVFLEFSKTKWTKQKRRTYQFTQGYNILRLQLHHLTQTFIIHNKYILTLVEKWFPFQGERAHSLLLLLYMLIERRRRKTEQQQQFTKGCNSLHRLQVYHLTLTFIIHNKYTSTLYLYTYMHIPILEKWFQLQGERGRSS